MPILILTNSGTQERSIGAVAAHLEAAGREVIRLEADRFPVDGLLSLDEADRVWYGDRLLEPAAVWHRHADVGASVRDQLHPDWADACFVQAEIVLGEAMAALPGFHVDHPMRLAAMPDTLGLVRLARAAGLGAPRTLRSNDPAKIRAFVASCAGGAIRKLPHSSSLRVRTEAGVRYGRTDLVTAEDLEDDDRLRACPLVWQERIPKAREYRVTAVGRRLFSASVDPRGAGDGEVDWRQDQTLVKTFLADPLPPEIEAAVQRLMDGAGIEFATIDLIRTPDDRFVFLEMNTVSYFDFVERATGLPIARAVADLLLGIGPPRRSS